MVRILYTVSLNVYKVKKRFWSFNILNFDCEYKNPKNFTQN